MKKVIFAVLILAAAGAGIGYYQFNKPHQNMERAAAEFSVSAEALFGSFEADEQQANEEYLDKVVAVSGTVREVSKDNNGQLSITLDSGSDMFGVICQMDELTDHEGFSPEPGQKLTLKGKCTGMLMDVVLVRCVKM
ncbi:OB-fold protein [Phaeodactylibacter luteus]|uniref:tRNA_anti-like n=1 Tax=Phaeodactylibacter luteus TaxID=1564516 RepID=A0A5C6RKC7_9BACT|nr:hypothetical protein [Phaeodactylibacter luteus]TXB62339.1 hypothetical protein FRY97_14350 [Phaeodactylibacter luteus]